ncbi:MAG: GNAT family N-acetyltransferase [Elainellaceae cyanobacterium]
MSDPSALPNSCQLRPACVDDSWQIRKLVLFAKLDPTQLRWSQFWVIECDQTVVACGQLRSFENAQELGSLVVSRSWRGKGFGRLLTQHLIDIATQPLYLECLGDRLFRFYAQFGFVLVNWDDLPDSLKRKFGLSKLATRIFRIPLHIMAYEPSLK